VRLLSLQSLIICTQRDAAFNIADCVNNNHSMKIADRITLERKNEHILNVGPFLKNVRMQDKLLQEKMRLNRELEKVEQQVKVVRAKRIELKQRLKEREDRRATAETALMEARLADWRASPTPSA
jgi:hypothetical protein